MFTNQNFKIAVSFKDGNDLDKINKLKNKQFLSVAELRVDLFSGEISPETIKQELAILKQAGLETILTIRTHFEGGKWKKDEAQRIELFLACFEFADFVDIEFSSIQKEPNFDTVLKTVNQSKTKLILSYHNFEKTPSFDLLVNKVKAMKEIYVDVVKIATTVQAQKDIIILTKLLFECNNLIVIGMGSLLSRVFFPAFGSILTFAHLGKSSALGQIHLDEMVDYSKKFYTDINE